MRRQLLVIAVALVALVAPIPSSLVERVYSRGVFSWVQPLMTTLSNLTAVAWFDVLLVAVVMFVGVLTVREWRRHTPLGAVGRLLRHLLVLGASLYLAFLLLWGFNYRRESMRTRVPFDTSRIGGQLFVIQPEVALFALVLAAAVGLGAGLYPALRAARLPPVIALKSE